MREKDLTRVRRLTASCIDTLNQLGVSRKDVAEKCADLEASFRRLERTICERTDRPRPDARRKKLRRQRR